MSFLSSPTSLIGEYLGMESCFDLEHYDNGEIDSSLGKIQIKNEGGILCDAEPRQIITRHRDQRWEMMKKRNGDFPPPMPSLARTENLPSHMPWVMKRYYTPDGRLIIREEKVRHHEYFRAHRANGRLTLHLVPLDQYHSPPPPDDKEESNEYSGEDTGCADPAADDAGEGREDWILKYNSTHNGEYEDEDEGKDKDKDKDKDKEEKGVGCRGNDENEVVGEGKIYKEGGLALAVEIGSSSSCGGVGNGGKCFQFNSSIGSPSSCMFPQVPVCTLRPVHS